MNKVNIANPIYDSVFKYLVEDKRIAKTLLSALLKKEVVRVDVRPHEYTNATRNAISMFRIDFSALVREDGGSEHLVLIELQKTWVETETLRFRQYLGAQYGDERNMREDGKYGIPMVAVYLMGHRVGDIEEPVLYSSHRACDYNGRPVTKGLPDPFVDSLIHDSIIVQIPLLRGQINNRLEKVLSVFDQTKADKYDKKLLLIDEDEYAGDEEMKYIVHRLTAAAADAKMRQDMNVEDEYYSVIEKRDTELMEARKELEESKKELTESKKELTENKKELTENKKALAENKKELEEHKKELEEHKKELAEKDARLGAMVQGMHSAGMSMEAIAKAAGMAIGDIEKYLKPAKS